MASKRRASLRAALTKKKAALLPGARSSISRAAGSSSGKPLAPRRRRSGWARTRWRAQEGQGQFQAARSGPPQERARASSRAALVLPEAGGPSKSRAGGSRSRSTSALRRPIVSSWARMFSNIYRLRLLHLGQLDLGQLDL